MLAFGTPARGPDGTILFGRDQEPFEIYIVSPDGQRFLVITSRQAQDSTSMSVVVNWQSQLPR